MTQIVGYRCQNPECNSIVGHVIGQYKLCSACYKFYRRNNRMPLKAEMRSSRKPTVQACPNCKRRPVYRKTPHVLCEVCSDYYERNGKMRPRYRDTDKCTNCSRPRPPGRSPFVHGRCPTCDWYFKKYGRERPERLWQRGKYGYCDCGKPATHKATVQVHCHQEELPLCDECHAEYQRQVAWYGDKPTGNLQQGKRLDLYGDD